MILFVYRNITWVALIRPGPLADLNPLAQLNKRLEVCISQLLDTLGCNMAIIYFQTMLQIMWLKVWYCTQWWVAEDLVLFVFGRWNTLWGLAPSDGWLDLVMFVIGRSCDELWGGEVTFTRKVIQLDCWYLWVFQNGCTQLVCRYR